MAEPGNNKPEEALAQAKADIEKLTAELEKQRGVVLNAEKKFTEWAAERGTERKAVGEVANELAAASKKLREAIEAQEKLRNDLAEARTKLAEAEKGKGPAGDQGNNRNEPPKPEQSADEIEAALSEDEQKELDEAWKKASPKKRAALKSNDPALEAERVEFLLKAKEAASLKAASDLGTWRKKPSNPKGSQPSGGDELDVLFGIKKQSAEDYPDGSQGGVPRRRRAAEASALPPGVRKASWVQEG